MLHRLHLHILHGHNVTADLSDLFDLAFITHINGYTVSVYTHIYYRHCT